MPERSKLIIMVNTIVCLQMMACSVFGDNDNTNINNVCTKADDVLTDCLGSSYQSKNTECTGLEKAIAQCVINFTEDACAFMSNQSFENPYIDCVTEAALYNNNNNTTSKSSVFEVLSTYKIVNAARSPSHYLPGYSDTTDGWYGEGITHSNTVPSDLRHSLYWEDTAGIANAIAGKEICIITGQFTFSNVVGFDPKERQVSQGTYQTDNCKLGWENLEVEYAWQILEIKNNLPTAIMRWNTDLYGAVDTPSDFMYDSGYAELFYVCPAGANYNNVGCKSSCAWYDYETTSGYCPTLDDFGYE